MKNCLKTLLIILLVYMFIPSIVFAHPGGLDSNGCHYCRTNCVKWGLNQDEYHCHSGNSYTNSKGQTFNKEGVMINDGSSSSNSGTTETTPSTPPTVNNDSSNNGSSSSSSDNTSSSNSTTNSNTTTNTNTNSNVNSGSSSSSSSNANSNSNSSNSSSSTKKPSTNASSDKTEEVEEAEKEEKKSNDATIKTLKINGKSVDIVDNMFVETTKKSLNLKITANSKKAKVDYEQKELVMGENEIDIKVTAEDGTEKEYKLVVKRVEGPGTATIVELSLETYDIEFDNYKAEISVTKGETIENISYKLSDNNATLKLYVNDKEVKRITKLKGNDILTLVTIDEDNNKLTYEVKINEMGPIESFIFNIIVYGIVIIMMGAPIVGAIFAFKYIKKKIKK